MKLIKTITLHKFPTHVKIVHRQKAKYKKGKLTNQSQAGKSKYMKVNLNRLYDGSMHFIYRQKVIKYLHDYIDRQLRGILPIPEVKEASPLVIRGMMYVPKNFGNVRMTNNEIVWSPAKSNYFPNWDMLNTGALWVKVFEDCICRPEVVYNKELRAKIIPDDNAGFVSGTGEMRRRFIDNLDERKIVFNIYEDNLDEEY